MKRVLLALIFLTLVSCERKESNLIVTGQVKGLKKGTLFLERIQDTSLIIIDSMIVNGEPDFVLQADLEEPEVLHLRLQTTNTEAQRISFFADKGSININTTLKRFFYDATIIGSIHQEQLDEFNEMISKFNDKNLVLIKEQFDAGEDTVKLNKIAKEADNLLKMKYLYAINFAINNKESEVAPYIAIAEIYDANVKYLDTIYNSLPDHIAKSKYGSELAIFIKERKANEKH